MRDINREVNVVGWQDNTRKNGDTIWEHLKSPLSKKYYAPNYYVKANLLFLDIKGKGDIKELTPLNSYCEERGNKISFELCYDVNFKDTDEDEWAKRARRIFNAIRISVESTDKITQRAIKKVVVRFWVDSLSESYLSIVDVKNNLNKYEGQNRYDCDISLSVDVENNLPADWSAAYKKSVSCWKKWNNSKNLTDVFTVRFNINTDSGETTNLRYFFPINNFFKRKNACVWLYAQGSDFSRIRQYMSVMNYEKDTLDGNRVLINDYFLGKTTPDKLNKRDSSDILPMVVFGQKDNLHALNVIKVLKNQYKAYMFNVESYFSDSDREAYNETQNELKAEKEKAKKNFSVIEELENKLAEIEAKYKPTKEQLCKILNKRIYINDSNFTNLIFSFLIRRLLRDRRIFLSESDGLVIDESKVKTAWFDAKSYAEGLVQLIENAQLHSEGHTAYFGMRYYKADSSVSMSKLSGESNTRIRLWERYRRKSPANSIFNQREYYDFLEFFVLDDAIDKNGEPKGILDKFGETEDEAGNPVNEIKENAIKSIGNIFDLSEGSYKDDYKENFYTVHYGMRWAHRHVKKLAGIMEILSPCTKIDAVEAQGYTSFAGADLKDYVEDLYYTEYSILIPLKYKDNKKNKGSVINKGNKFISFKDCKDGFENFNFGKIIDIFDDFIPESKKTDSVDNLSAFFNKKLLVYKKYCKKFYFKDIDLNEFFNKKTIHKKRYYKNKLYIDAYKFINSYNNEYWSAVEVLIKSIIRVVYDRSKSNQNDVLFIALYFGNENKEDIEIIKEYAKEAARLLAIFYDKQIPKSFLNKIQIAICTDSYTDPHRKEVNFILAGDSLASAYRTATNFVYYNSEASLEFVPLLEFYNDGKENGTSTDIFPFDLYLNDRAKRKSDGKEEERNWFLWLMLDRLETSLSSEGYGCKVGEIRARIGSKIHLSNFYEAELLFQNSGTVMRFAYLLASDIIKSKYIQEDCINVITGYENYSTVLILEATKLLQEYYKNRGNYSIYWVVDVKNETSDERLPRIKFEGELKNAIKEFEGELKKEKKEREIKNINCITVIPVNAVMATVYKVHASFKRGIGELLKNKKEYLDEIVNYPANYCLVAVGDVFVSGKIDNDFIENYVNKIENNKDNSIWGEAILVENKAGKEGITVKYLLPVSSEWVKPDKLKPIEDYKEQFPLLQVDKTSTLLDTYFQSELNEEAKKYYKY